MLKRGEETKFNLKRPIYFGKKEPKPKPPDLQQEPAKMRPSSSQQWVRVSDTGTLIILLIFETVFLVPVRGVNILGGDSCLWMFHICGS